MSLKLCKSYVEEKQANGNILNIFRAKAGKLKLIPSVDLLIVVEGF